MTKKEREKTKKIDEQLKDKNLSPGQIKRAKRRKEQIKRKFMIRRILLALAAVLIIVRIVKLVGKKSSKLADSYPEFRDQVESSMEDEVLVGDTSNRILNKNEKLADFDQLYESISKNFPICSTNKDSFADFNNDKDDYRKKIEDSKTDQEFFQIINNYLAILNNSQTKILSKNRFDDYFTYYKDDSSSPQGVAIQNQQTIDRYKRMISTTDQTAQMEGEILNNHVLHLTFKDFSIKNIDSDIKTINKFKADNPQVNAAIIDLRDNDSSNDIYRQRLAPVLINNDVKLSLISFYRGNMFANSLASLKKDPRKIYQTSFVKNPADKYQKKVPGIKLDDYLYYDEVMENIKKDASSRNLSLYILTNDKTSGEALNFAKALKLGGGYLTLASDNLENSIKTIGVRPDLLLLKHSGLIITVADSYTVNDENSRLDYDGIIDSQDPLQNLLNIIG